MNKKWLLGSAVLLLLVGSLLYWWPVLADTTPSTCPPLSKCIFNDSGSLLIQTQNGDIDLKLATSTAVQNITIDTSPINGNIYLTTKANGSTTENYIYFNRRSPTTYGLSVSASGFLYHDGNRLVIEDGRTYSITSQNSDESNFSGALMGQEGEFIPLDFKGRQPFTVSSNPTYWGFSSGDIVAGLSSIYSYFDTPTKLPLTGQLAFVRNGTTTKSTQQLQFRFNDSEFPDQWGPWREICDYSNNCHNFINVLDDSNTGDVVIYQDPDLLISSGLKIASTSSLLNCTVLSTVSGEITCGTSTPGGGDNLGDHTATQNIRLNKHWLSYDGDDEGVFVDKDGKVGIGTTSPATKFHIYDATSGPIITLSGLDTNYRGLTIKNTSNNEKWFIGNNTSSNFVIRATNTNDILTISSSTGNVGIGTSTPSVKLDVNGSIRSSNLATPWGVPNRCLYVGPDGIIQAKSSDCGEAYFAGNGLSLSSTTFSLAASGANNYITKWTSTNTLGASTIYDDGTSVGIGTVNPGITLAIGDNYTGLHWLGGNKLAIYSNNKARIEINPTDTTGITVRGNDNNTWATLKTTSSVITLTLGTGGADSKLDVGTVDPLYTIGGKHYATYMSGMTGVKEETSGVLTLDKNSAGLFMAKLDFAQSPVGSDLWLFGRTTNIINNQEHFNEISCLLTPNFSGKTWYEKDWGSKSLTIFARPDNNQRERVEVSYRLTAPRFDSNSWNNYSSSESEGFNLDQLLK